MSLPSRPGQLAGRAKASSRALLPLPHRKFTPFFIPPQIFHQFFSKIFNFSPFPPILCPNSTPSGGLQPPSRPQSASSGGLSPPTQRRPYTRRTGSVAAPPPAHGQCGRAGMGHPSAPYTEATLRAAAECNHVAAARRVASV